VWKKKKKRYVYLFQTVCISIQYNTTFGTAMQYNESPDYHVPVPLHVARCSFLLNSDFPNVSLVGLLEISEFSILFGIANLLGC
jgi:hypothetical protein